MRDVDLLLKGQLTLQKFWFYIQPTMHTMGLLASVAASINRVSTCTAVYHSDV